MKLVIGLLLSTMLFYESSYATVALEIVKLSDVNFGDVRGNCFARSTESSPGAAKFLLNGTPGALIYCRTENSTIAYREINNRNSGDWPKSLQTVALQNFHLDNKGKRTVGLAYVTFVPTMTRWPDPPYSWSHASLPGQYIGEDSIICAYADKVSEIPKGPWVRAFFKARARYGLGNAPLGDQVCENDGP